MLFGPLSRIEPAISTFLLAHVEFENPIETLPLLCSSHPSHTQLLRVFAQSLHALGPHSIFYVFNAAITHWFTESNAPYSTVDLHGFPSRMHEAIQQALKKQSLIRWEPTVKGFLTSTWHSLASLHMDFTFSVNWVLGTHHMRAILKALHPLTSFLLKARNKVIHNKDKHANVQQH